MSLQEEVMTENDISEVHQVSTTTTSSIYDRKRHHSKAIRVLTVLAYILSVSLAAIILSIYYIFVWEGHPTLAAMTYPQPDVILESENLQAKTLQEVSRKRDTSIFFNGNKSITSKMVDNNVHKGSVSNEEKKKCEEKNQDNESQNYSEYDLLNNSENSTDWIVTNNSLNLDEYGTGPRDADPTMDYEDSTYYTTPASDENSTWFSELDDFNSDYGILNKRSVFLKKLMGHHNIRMPK